MTQKFHGLIAAVHTPFSADGSLHLGAIEKQAAHLQSNKIATVFIGGSTGESHSLTLDERMRLAVRWSEVTRNSALRVIVHVGSNCLADARTLAEQAQRLGVAAISALASSYFKPNTVDTLISCCASIAEAAPETPFYFYDIPVLTGVSLSMPDFLQRASSRIRNLAGIKFTNVDFMVYQLCLAAVEGRFDIPWGVDEMLLPALACGAQAAIGSTYNFAAPLYHRLMAAFDQNDFPTARREQLASIQLVRTLAKRGYLASSKALMAMLGVDVGQPRLPNTCLVAGQIAELRQELEPFGLPLR